MLYAKQTQQSRRNGNGPLKGFDKLSHSLFFCKLKTYGFNANALTFIQSYFLNRHQRTKVGDKLTKSLDFDKLFPNFIFNDTTIKNITEEKIFRKAIDNKLSLKINAKRLTKKFHKYNSRTSK